MTWLLDTDICIYFMEGRAAHVRSRIRRTPAPELGIPAIATAELRYGAVHSGRRISNSERLTSFLESLHVYPFDDEAARHFADLKHALVSAGTPIGPMDMLIAATALANDAILVTNNTREFSRVPGLRLENWLEPLP